MRARRLRHRCTYIVVRSLDGSSLLVHRRADWKDQWPGRWDLAFGGVCAVGEDWAESARRELSEEAGISTELVELGPVRFDGEVRVVGRVFATACDGPFRFDDGEVVEVAWVGVDELDRWLADHEVCDDSAVIVPPLVQGRAQARSGVMALALVDRARRGWSRSVHWSAAERDAPAEPVRDAVVVAADEDEVVEIGPAVVLPVDEVVGVAPRGRCGAARERAAAVAGGERSALSGGGVSVGAAGVEGHAEPVEDARCAASESQVSSPTTEAGHRRRARAAMRA